MRVDALAQPKQTTLGTLLLGQVVRVFVESFDARTLLGTVTWLFIPASDALYMDKPAGDLLWTSLRVI